MRYKNVCCAPLNLPPTTLSLAYPTQSKFMHFRTVKNEQKLREGRKLSLSPSRCGNNYLNKAPENIEKENGGKNDVERDERQNV